MNGTYDALGLYHGPDDPRLFVPKPNPIMGWTVNVSHRFGPPVLLALGMLVGAAITAAILRS